MIGLGFDKNGKEAMRGESVFCCCSPRVPFLYLLCPATQQNEEIICVQKNEGFLSAETIYDMEMFLGRLPRIYDAILTPI